MSSVSLLAVWLMNDCDGLFRPSNARNSVLAIPFDATTDSGTAGFASPDETAEGALEAVPAAPPIRAEPSFPRGRAMPTLTDLEAARRDVVLHLDCVCDKWGIVQLAASTEEKARPEASVPNQAINERGASDMSEIPLRAAGAVAVRVQHGESFLPSLLTATTAAVRAVQKFMATLPPEAEDDTGLAKSTSQLGIGVSTAARPGTARRSITPRLVPMSDSASWTKQGGRAGSWSFSGPDQTYHEATPSLHRSDILKRLRRASLDVLGCLKGLEERFRVPESASAIEITGRSSSPLPPLPPLSSSSLLDPDLEASSVSASAESEGLAPTVAWDYRDDLTLEDVSVEAEVVRTWLQTVHAALDFIRRSERPLSTKTRPPGAHDETLGIRSDAEDGPERFSGLKNEAVGHSDDEGGWAFEISDVDRRGPPSLRRAHALLASHLPASLSHFLGQVGPFDGEGAHDGFLDSLACVQVPLPGGWQA